MVVDVLAEASTDLRTAEVRARIEQLLHDPVSWSSVRNALVDLGRTARWANRAGRVWPVSASLRCVGDGSVSDAASSIDFIARVLSIESLRALGTVFGRGDPRCCVLLAAVLRGRRRHVVRATRQVLHEDREREELKRGRFDHGIADVNEQLVVAREVRHELPGDVGAR